MAKKVALDVPRADLLQHPAVKAWSKLAAGRVVPGRIEILQERKKSAVYRLVHAGPGGCTVVAKRRPMAIGLIERKIYEQILPRLPASMLHYYGFTEESGAFCWLFLEDAGDQRFSPLSKEHRELAARWLGLMHTSAARIAAEVSMPDRGPNHYLDQLRSARQAILLNLGNPVFTASDVALMEALVSQCNVLESRWSHVEQSCEGIPPTLTHGDFRPKNVHVRDGALCLGLGNGGLGSPGRRPRALPGTPLRTASGHRDLLVDRARVLAGFRYRGRSTACECGKNIPATCGHSLGELESRVGYAQGHIAVHGTYAELSGRAFGVHPGGPMCVTNRWNNVCV
jgi:hypothetical protein